MRLQTVINHLRQKELQTFLIGLGATGELKPRELTTRSISIAILGQRLQASCGMSALDALEHLGRLYFASAGLIDPHETPPVKTP